MFGLVKRKGSHEPFQIDVAAVLSAFTVAQLEPLHISLLLSLRRETESIHLHSLRGKE